MNTDRHITIPRTALALFMAFFALVAGAQVVVDENFNASNGGWEASADNVGTFWEWGDPAATQINDDYDGGGNAWVTELDGSFTLSDYTYMYLSSPAYDFTGLPQGYVSLSVNYDLSSDIDDDAMQLYFSTDSADWHLLRKAGAGSGWFNGTGIDGPGWVGNSSGWEKAGHALPDSLMGEPAVYFLLEMTPNLDVGNYGYEGFAIDNFKISSSSIESEILSMTVPEEIFPANVDAVSKTVTLFVPGSTDVTSLSPTFTLSSGAASDKTSGSTHDFSSDVSYNITAEDTDFATSWLVTVENPELDLSILPQSAREGDDLAIYGKAFSTTTTDNVVTIGGIAATVTAASATKLVVTVPAGVPFGASEVSVTVNGLTSSPGTYFTLLTADNVPNFLDYKGSDFNLDGAVTSMELGDFDADGDFDLAYDNGTTLVIATLEDGRIKEKTTVASGRVGVGAQTLALKLADMDNDGFLDVVAGGERLGWFKNNGDGSWSGEMGIDDFGSEYTIEVFDADGDFKLDIIAEVDGSLKLFRNLGSGGFSGGAPNIASALGIPFDWDEDGDVDMLYADGNNDWIVLLENDGAGVFTDSTLYATTAIWLNELAIGDLDNDGDVDFVYTTFDGVLDSKVGYVLNNANTSFGSEAIIQTEDGWATGDMELADLNGDGYLDIVRALEFSGDGYAEIYYGDASLTFNDKQGLEAGIQTFDVEVVDIDSDGDLDILLEASIDGGFFPLELNQELQAPDLSLATEDIDQTAASPSWTQVNGANGYELEVSTTEDFSALVTNYDPLAVSPATTTTADVTDLSSGTTYYLRVRSRDAGDKTSDYSAMVSFLTLPGTPVGAPAEDVGRNSFTAGWSAVTSATEYVVEVSSDNFASIIFADTTTETSSSVTGLTGDVQYQYRILATNATGSSPYSSEVLVTTLAENVAPTGISLDNDKVNENSETGTLVASISTTDSDNTSHTYSLVAGTGDDNNASFMIDGSSLKTNAIFNHEDKSSYSIRIQTMDADNATFEKSFSVSITDVNDAPTAVTLSSTSTTAFLEVGTKVADLSASDEDDTSHTFELTSGTEAFSVSGTELSTAVKFENETDSTVSITVKATDDSGANISTSFDITVGAFVDGEAPVITLSATNSETFLSNGPSLTLGATVTDFRLAEVKFMSRLLTESDFTESILTSSNDEYAVTIEETTLGAAGIEYFFQATDAAGNTGVSDKAKMILEYPSSEAESPVIESIETFGRTVDKYQIISIPYVFSGTNNRIDAIFNEYGGNPDNRTWRIIRFDNSQAELVDLTASYQVGLGEAYFFIAEESKEIRVGQATVNSEDPFTIQLRAGWNLIGNPYNVDIDWSAVLTRNGVEGTVRDLRVLDPSNPEIWPESTVLPKFEGGFVQSDEDLTITISYEDAVAGSGRSTPPSSFTPTAEWYLPITLQQGESVRHGGVGMDREARTSLDKFDELTLPRWLQFLEISFLHADEQFGRYNKDIVPVTDAHVWEFEVSSSYKGGSVLRWDAASIGTENLQLLNVRTGEIVNMKETSVYHFDLQGTTTFRMLYSTNPDSQFDFEKIQVMDVFPNPITESFAIPVRLPGSSGTHEVDLEITDVSGRVIWTKHINGLSSGAHELWVDRPQNMTSGVYLCKIRVSNDQRQSIHTQRIRVR